MAHVHANTDVEAHECEGDGRGFAREAIHRCAQRIREDTVAPMRHPWSAPPCAQDHHGRWPLLHPLSATILCRPEVVAPMHVAHTHVVCMATGHPVPLEAGPEAHCGQTGNWEKVWGTGFWGGRREDKDEAGGEKQGGLLGRGHGCPAGSCMEEVARGVGCQ